MDHAKWEDLIQLNLLHSCSSYSSRKFLRRFTRHVKISRSLFRSMTAWSFNLERDWRTIFMRLKYEQYKFWLLCFCFIELCRLNIYDPTPLLTPLLSEACVKLKRMRRLRNSHVTNNRSQYILLDFTGTCLSRLDLTRKW